MFEGDDHLVWFEYTDFRIVLNPFTSNPGWHILARSVSSPDRNEANMKNEIIPLILYSAENVKPVLPGM